MELEDRRDNLRLLARLCYGLSQGKDEALEDYEPPSVELAEYLHTTPDPAVPGNPGYSREMEIRAFISQTGGE